MDPFDKCFAYTRHKEVEALGLYPYFNKISENHGPTVTMNNERIVMAGTNNYLGLTIDPRVKEAAIEAVKRYGTGCSGSRLLNGTYELHVELEEKLAGYAGKEAALLFSTGFQTNQGCIVPLIGKKDVIICDRENHSSIIQGALITKGIYGKSIIKYKHNDMESLEKAISRVPDDCGKVIISDGVFSMLGDIVKLPELVSIAKRHNARILIDDAHGLGVLGRNGRGTPNHFGLDDEVDIIMGTFSKSFASQGGFIASKKEVVDFIKHNSPALIFSASMPPAQVTTVLKTLEIIESEPERIERLNAIQTRVRNELRSIGFDVPDGETPIVPVVISDDILTFQFWRELLDNGVFVNAVISPAVPNGKQLLRLSFMSEHTEQHIDFVLEKFEEVGKKLGVIQEPELAYKAIV